MCEVLIPVAPEVGLCVKALEKTVWFQTGEGLSEDFESGLTFFAFLVVSCFYRCDMRKVPLWILKSKTSLLKLKLTVLFWNRWLAEIGLGA